MLAAAVVVAAMSSCSAEEKPTTENRVAVRFDANISAEVSSDKTNGAKTRAVDAQWSDGDQIGIYMVKAGQPLTPENIAEEVEDVIYATDGTGAFVPSEGETTIYYPIEGSVDFVAYYPHGNALYTSAVGYRYLVDLTDQSDQEAIDFMYAKTTGKDKSQPAVELEFKHMLSKIVFNITPGEGLTQDDLDNLVVTIARAGFQQVFLLNEGMFDRGTATITITTKATDPGVLYEAILMPYSEFSTYEVTFNLNNGADEPFNWTMNQTLAPGTKYTFNATLNRTAADVTGTISDWNKVDGGSVIAD
jgi:hypothetical protein